MNFSKLLPGLLTAILFLVAMPHAHAAETIDAIRKAGALNCGVVADEDDYSEADTHGNLSRLGADYCRALGAEIFSDPGKAKIFTWPDEPSALAALHARKLDVVFGTTPNPVIGSVYGIGFGPPIFFDGQGFLVARRLGIKTLDDLSRRHVCFINASPPEQGLYDGLEPHLKTPETRFPFSERGEMNIAFLDGHCDAITGDVSWMANVRASFQSRKSEFEILPQTISIDPFSPAYRSGDSQWASLVDWTVWALLQAEEHGVTRANVRTMDGSNDPTVRRLVGAMPWIGKSLGISDRAFGMAIAAVGNQSEIYDRDVGSNSPLDLPRGRNMPASQGGLMWALPVEPLQ